MADGMQPTHPDPATPLIGGEMARRVCEIDWAKTPLGPMDRWPRSLRTLVDMLLAHPLPTIVLWGPELIQIYNDGYARIAANKHPAMLGKPTHESWPEVWHINGPLYERVMREGESVLLEDQLFRTTRRGKLEDAWFTLTYSPVRDDRGAVAGVILTILETTARVLAELDRDRHEAERRRAEAALRDSETRLKQVLQQVPVGVAAFEQVLEVAATVLESECASMQLLVPDDDAPDRGGTLRLLAHRGLHPESARFWERVDVASTSTCGDVLQTRERSQVEDVEQSAEITGGVLEAFRRSGIRAAQTTPLIASDGRLLGTISTHWRRPFRPSPERLAVFDVVARHASHLVERAQADAALRAAESREAAEAAALRQAETRFRLLFEKSLDAILVADDQGRYLAANDAACQLLGYSREQLQGMRVADLRVPAPRDVADEYRSYVDKGEAIGQFEFIRADGEKRVAEYAATEIAPGQHLSILRDITERRRAEAALRECEAKYRALFETMQEGFGIAEILVDAAGRPVDYRMLDINPQFERLTGQSRDAFLTGRTVREVAPELEEHWYEFYGRVGLTGEPAHAEIHAEAWNRWFEVSAFRVGTAEQRRVGILYSEITARKRAEAALRESEARLRRVVDVEKVGVLYFRLDGRIVDANPALEQMTGYTVAELRRLPHWSALTRPEFEEQTNRAAADLAETGRTAGYETECVRKDGSRFWGLVAPTRVAGSGPDAECVEFVIDITDRKHMEEALRDADRRKDDFMATLAHELRNPLAPIQTGIDLLQSVPADSRTAITTRAVMDRQIGLMVRLIDDLLDISRVRLGKVSLKPQRLELRPIIEAAIAAAQPLIAARHHELFVNLPDDPVWLDADASRLQQVFGNLLTNAAKYTHDGGRIDLTARRDGRDVVVAITDNGAGLRADRLGTIFEMFAQGDATSSPSGLGIGLALVRQLVEMHRGTVFAESPGPGQGSTFTVRLPAAPGLQQPGTGASGFHQTDATAAVRRVLIVDDNADAAETLADLVRLLGHDARTAHDGPAALEIARAFGPEFVFCDLSMPGMDGYELAHRLRAAPGAVKPVLVALSGAAADRERSAKAGFDVHLTKPVLRRAVQDLLDRITDARAGSAAPL